MIHLSGVTYTYPGTPRPALQDLSLEIPRGQFCALVGPNDAGKSTLALAVAGFIPHFYRGRLQGNISIAGRATLDQPLYELVQTVGLVFQNPFNQISGARFTVREEIAFGLENLGLDPVEMERRVETAMGAMDIADLAERSPLALSGGQMQRVALASVLAMQPRVLVLDEPTSQLDPVGTREVFSAVRALASEQEITVLMIEHRVEWVAAFADRVVVLVEGSVLLDGRPQDVFTDPRLPENGVGLPRYTRIARRAAAEGLWPADRSLPITLGEAVEGFSLALPSRVAELQPEETSPPPSAPLESAPPAADLRVQDLAFEYPGGVLALQGVSLQVEPGERLAIIGQNGAGKTTLVKHFNGLLKPTRGQVLVGGWDTRAHSVARLASRVGYVFQNPDEQLFARSVQEEVAFGPKNLGYSADRTERLVADALALTGLADRRETNPYDLSRTGRKLVAVASVLAMDTPVVILDEPTTGQDQARVEGLSALIDELRSRGKTVLTISHDIDFCAENFDRLVVMGDGSILRDGPTPAVLADTITLERADVEQPQITRLGLALGLRQAVATTEDLLRVFRRLRGEAQARPDAGRPKPD